MWLSYSPYPPQTHPSPRHVSGTFEPSRGFGSLALLVVNSPILPSFPPVLGVFELLRGFGLLALREFPPVSGVFELLRGFGLLALREPREPPPSSMDGENKPYHGQKFPLTSKRPPSMDGYSSVVHSYLTSRDFTYNSLVTQTPSLGIYPATVSWSYDLVYSSLLTLRSYQLLSTFLYQAFYPNRFALHQLLYHTTCHLESVTPPELDRSKVGTVRSVRSGASSERVRFRQPVRTAQMRISPFLASTVSLVLSESEIIPPTNMSLTYSNL